MRTTQEQQARDDRLGKFVAIALVVAVGYASFMTGRGVLIGSTRYRDRAVALDPDHAKHYFTKLQTAARDRSARETSERMLASLEERFKALDARVAALESAGFPNRPSVASIDESSTASDVDVGGALRAVVNGVATDVLTVFPASSDEGALALGEVHIHERPLQL
jgi:hypothetical protein